MRVQFLLLLFLFCTRNLSASWLCAKFKHFVAWWDILNIDCFSKKIHSNKTRKLCNPVTRQGENSSLTIYCHKAGALPNPQLDSVLLGKTTRQDKNKSCTQKLWDNYGSRNTTVLTDSWELSLLIQKIKKSSLKK